MNIIQKFLDLSKKLWHTSVSENTEEQKGNPEFKQNNVSPSLEDLKKAGLTIEPVSDPEIVDKEKLIYASQLPVHIFPWVVGMKSGLYLVKFPPTIQSQINSGFLNITGGVARNPSGQVMVHGTGASLLFLSPLILYQVGVISFGSYYLQKISESLKKINKKLDEISFFLLDKRSAEISGQLLELSHISKGIIEFNRLGHVTEVLTRVDLIKHIRIMNLPNLLHLQKNLTDKLNNLRTLKKSSWFRSKKETMDLLDSIDHYETILIDYSRSLLLNIICTDIEVSFSICNSFKEIKSRLSSQKNQTEFLRTQSSEFETALNKKFSELIEDSWSNDRTIEERRGRIKASWEKTKKTIFDLDTKYTSHIQLIEDKMRPKDNVIFLQKLDSNEDKKTA